MPAGKSVLLKKASWMLALKFISRSMSAPGRAVKLLSLLKGSAVVDPVVIRCQCEKRYFRYGISCGHSGRWFWVVVWLFCPKGCGAAISFLRNPGVQ